VQICDLIAWATQELKIISSTPRLDAELLIGHVLRLTRAQLITRSDELPSADAAQAFKLFIERRKTGEPVAYLLGQREFWSLNLKVTSATLIPRPETELLVEIALQEVPKNKMIRVADLGTGAGAIALALANECPDWQIIATDNSSAALAVAKDNAQQLMLSNINFRQGSWCDVFAVEEKFAMIVSNPPYIAIDDLHLQQPELTFEPYDALVGKENGFSELHKIIQQARYHLQKGGWLVLEHGFEQKKILSQLLCEYGYVEIENHKDFSGKMRVCVARLST